jgi:hypothetical protein
MDPYLEGSLWMSFHTQLAAEIARQLAPLIRPRYLALTAERFVLEWPDAVGITVAGLYPDVAVTQRRPDPLPGALAALSTATLRIPTVMATAVPHVTVEIRDAAQRQLVTAIEVLSPTNKRGEGRSEYLATRQRILASTAHLLEIDLLRSGQRVPMEQPLPPGPYFVFLSRAADRPWSEVWPIALPDPLPTVPVPLLGNDAEAPLDLQKAFATVYDAVGYDLAIDYASPPEISVIGADGGWVAEMAAKAST